MTKTNTNNNQKETMKVGNYNQYVHNPNPEHQVTRVVTTQEAINNVRKHFNPYEEDYIQNFNDRVNDSNNISEYIDYVSTDRYMESHYKTKESPRFEETYFNKQLEQMADVMLREYDNDSGKYADYTLLSDYTQEQSEYRNVAIETDEDSESVKKGLAIHANLLDQVDEGERQLELSERVKRKQRYKDVRNNLDRYPDLKQMYEVWEEMGYNYGFHEVYNKEEKEIIRQYWLAEFTKEVDNPYSPENRLRMINKHHNELGYDMHLALEDLRNPTQNLNKFNIVDVTTVQNDVVELLEDTFDLSNVDHVAVMLDIQKESKKARVVGIDRVQHVNEWYPILNMLEAKYEVSKRQGGISTVLHHLHAAIRYSDLEGYQKEIIKLIRQQDKYIKSLGGKWVDKLLSNPYKMIVEYINDKYNMRLDMRQLNREIDKIAREITYVHADLMGEEKVRECVECNENKLPSAFYSGRNTCKKCYTNKQVI